MNQNLIGRPIKWTSDDKTESTGYIRGEMTIVAQNQVSGQPVPLWIFLVEVTSPEKRRGQVCTVGHGASDFRLLPQLTIPTMPIPGTTRDV